MKKYIEFVFDNNTAMPDCEQDIIRLSSLHSWYKHLGDFTIAYPLLMCGEEPRYSFDPRFTDEDQNNFHWTLVMDYDIDNYRIQISNANKFITIPNCIKNFMKQFPIYLNGHFSIQSDAINDFFRTTSKNMCAKYWDELLDLKNSQIAITI